ncbi:DUF3299 domain-containing protein [Vibrio sp. D404a]|uniref:DUF3299 domain-containing protein n=1 Tax=unclassified Vibrio TaxID=2614977 RepID=UPI0025559A10|nr:MULTISPECIES: DUF3299 domain-containing protein [unclassified Vibrio]MDK9735685.1 DUF3299 domain-containing protein [Vibrio sp. D404a]MDK9798601.1 DUF3299 domain-containing protein [Vibrio sp. D449a]
MKRILFIASLIMVTLSSASFAANQVRYKNTVEIEWLDLNPERERARVSDKTFAALDHSANVAQQALVGSARPELHGSNVKIPGFVIPLEGDSESISEFLLVPFYGACIHVPPPPPNQIIYVKFEEGAPTKDLWDIVYITGTLKAETVISDDIGVESGYSIDGASLEIYSKA